eukprot:4647156-Lingulodinium_polyedra.AAC.1
MSSLFLMWRSSSSTRGFLPGWSPSSSILTSGEAICVAASAQHSTDSDDSNSVGLQMASIRRFSELPRKCSSSSRADSASGCERSGSRPWPDSSPKMAKASAQRPSRPRMWRPARQAR